MSEEELIKYFKNLTEITKRDNTKNLEVGVEISVEMAERLIGIIEQEKTKFILTYNTLNRLSHFNDIIPKQAIRDKIKELNNMTKKIYKHRKPQRYTLNEIQAIKGVLKELLEEE